MRVLTRQLATEQAAVLKVVLSETVAGYVRRLDASQLEDLVEAIQLTPGARARRLTAMTVCDSTGAPLFDSLEQAEGELDGWPPIWLMKLADAAGQVNGLHVGDLDDPE